MDIHRSTGTTTLDFVLCLPPPDFKLDYTTRRYREIPKSDLQEYYFQPLQVSIPKLQTSLDRT